MSRNRLSRRAATYVLLLFALASNCVWLVPARAEDKRATSYRAALESITAARLKAHVAWLADDAREGREAGTTGGYAAGDYVAEHLAKWKLRPAGDGGTYVQEFSPNYRNFLAVLPGRDPALRGEYILIGAHYDHVGYAASGATLGRVGDLHNGADDNASGTSGVLQLAQAMTLLAEPPRRSIVFAFWDAEELGMLGTKHWTAHPTLPLDRIRLCVNLDMIGRLRDQKLWVFGGRSAAGLRRIVAEANESSGLKIDFPWPVAPIGDHFTFFAKGVPALAFHTGEHSDYHRGTDKADRIVAGGMQSIDRLVFQVVYDTAEADALPAFREAARSETAQMQQSVEGAPSKLPERLGVRWDADASAEGGVQLTEVLADTAALRAGLKLGDRLVQFAGREIHSGDDLSGAVATAPPRTTAVVHRQGQKPAPVNLELAGAPMRWGFTWRVDDAEPGALILTRVVPGTPAARAGLAPGDRLLRIDGRACASEAEAAERLKQAAETVRLRIERTGQILHVELHAGAQPVRRAA